MADFGIHPQIFLFLLHTAFKMYEVYQHENAHEKIVFLFITTPHN